MSNEVASLEAEIKEYKLQVSTPTPPPPTNASSFTD